MKKLLLQIILVLFLACSCFGQTIKPPIGSFLDVHHPLARGMIAAYVMNENCGPKVYDLSGYEQHGTFVDNPTWAAGPKGPVVDFVDSAINVGGNVYDAACATECSIVFNLRRDTVGASLGRVIDKYPAPTIYTSNNAATDYPISFYGTIGGISRDLRWDSASTLPTGTWYTFALVLGSGYQYCYQNGLLVDLTLAGGPYSGVYSLGPGVNAYIGNRASDMARNLDGQIEYLYIYNRILTDSEVMQVYVAPYCMFKSAENIVWQYIQNIILGGQLIIITTN